MGDDITQDAAPSGTSATDRPGAVDNIERGSAPELENEEELEGEFEMQDKVVLILCGLIASGKSTFAKALQMHFPQFRRCNQDDLGSRQEVERAAREYLSQGYSICIDRTNFNAGQRAHWIRIAHEFPGTLVWVIVFDTPYEICAERLQKRTSHPTIKSAEEGLPILAQLANNFRHPLPYEGYNRILYHQPPPQLPSGPDSPEPESLLDNHTYTKSEVSVILYRVRDSPAIVPPPTSSASDLAASPGFGGPTSTASGLQTHWSTSPPRARYRGVPRGAVSNSRGRFNDHSSRDNWRGANHDRGRYQGHRGSGRGTRSLVSHQRHHGHPGPTSSAAPRSRGRDESNSSRNHPDSSSPSRGQTTSPPPNRFPGRGLRGVVPRS